MPNRNTSTSGNQTMTKRSATIFRTLGLLFFLSSAVYSQPIDPQSAEANITFNNFRDASLFEVLEILAQRLQINYIVDPEVQDGTVTINTYGTLYESDLLPLLETILRMNDTAAVQVGNSWHIVPLDEIARMPVVPRSDNTALPEDERLVLNAIRLNYVSAEEIGEILEPFLGGGARYSVIASANMLLVLDNTRNMQRTLELIQMFDAAELSQQRIRLFEVKHSLAVTLASELENVMQTLSLSEHQPAIRVLPLPRISSLLVVSPSEEILHNAEEWLHKLDREKAVGNTRNFIYQAQYGLAENLAGTLLQLYGASSNSAYPGNLAVGTGLNATGGLMGSPGVLQQASTGLGGLQIDGTGNYQNQNPGIRIVADRVNNLVLVQSTQQKWDNIRSTLLELDTPPRQVLINAKIYEVTLSGSLASGVSAYLRNRSSPRTTGKLNADFSATGLVGMSIGMLVGSTRELALFLEGSASEGKSKVISAPSLIVTDNIPAEITVGQSIPTLSSQAVAGGTFSQGSSLFTNTIQNVQTGVSLSVTARVNASGIITMQILQEVSTPTGISGPIQSPTIDRRNVRTQVTVNDGDTVAIAGIIQETNLYNSNRVPVLGKIPVIGWLFGGTERTTTKTELIVLLEPHVIYDQNQAVTATAELMQRMQSLRRLMRNDPLEDQKLPEKMP